MAFTQFLLLALGLLLLIAGAEILVRGAGRLAGAVGISPLVVGLTIVAFGTSAPEFAVSIQSAAAGQGDLALGNVVGSNIFNVLFILGISAVITPLLVDSKLVRIDVPLMIAVSLLVYGLALNGVISRFEGLILFAGILAYTLFAILQSRAEDRKDKSEYETEFGAGKPLTPRQVAYQLLLILLGLGLLVLGSRWLIEAGVILARSLGVSDLVIGLTLIAAGTSLPEVATSIIASLKGERDIAVGKVVGSNIFNLLAVLGASALLSDEGIQVAARAAEFDLLVMIAVAAACLPIFFTGQIIARWEGFFFLGYYLIYTAYLIVHATRRPFLSLFADVMLLFVIPLSAVTLLILGIRAFISRRSS